MYKYAIYFLILLLLNSCHTSNTNENSKHIWVKEVIKLSHNQTLFWFTNSELITSEGVNYFQIAGDICNLDAKKADAECEFPIGILKIQNDSIFIVTQDSFVRGNENRNYKIVSVEYDIKLRKILTIPDHNNGFLLKESCK